MENSSSLQKAKNVLVQSENFDMFNLSLGTPDFVVSD